MKRLDGKVAIVTGSGHGIGKFYAERLASEGARVVIAELDSKATEKTALELNSKGYKAIGIQTDVTSEASVANMVSETVKQFEKIDILVNNAAIFATIPMSRAPYDEISIDEWDLMMSVNVKGTWLVSKAVIAEMKKLRYGKIINIASGTVFKGPPMMLHYVTSKGAVVAMSRSLARELGDDGIRVNTLAPGLVMSEGVVANPAWKGAIVANNVASRAIKRDALPEDMTGTLIYLAAPESDFVTGQVLVVDGGSVMH